MNLKIKINLRGGFKMGRKRIVEFKDGEKRIVDQKGWDFLRGIKNSSKQIKTYIFL